eukprot:COSAG06_NODE_1157_length_10466_cov_3.303752_2_plen_1487_part_00
MSKASGKYRELPSSDEPAARSPADTPSRALLRERVEQAEARAAAARAEAAQFDKEQQRRESTGSGGRCAARQLDFTDPQLEPEPSALPVATQPPNGERSVQAEVAALRQQMVEQGKQVAALTPVHRDSISAISAPDTVSRHEHEAALAENAKLRQVVSSAKAVGGEENILRVLSVVDDHCPADGEEAHVQRARPPPAPSDRSLRVASVRGRVTTGVWFSPNAETLVICSEAKELTFLDLRTAEARVGLTRSGDMITGSIAPDKKMFCVAAKDGLAVYELASDEQMSCTLLWEAMRGTSFIDVDFSRDSSQIASVRAGGLLEIRNARTSELIASVEDFPVALKDNEPGALSFSSALLAVGGRMGKRSDKQVRLLDTTDFAEVQTLRFDAMVFSVEFSPDSCTLAVGTNNPGQVHLFSSEDDWTTPVRLGTPVPAPIVTMRFSHDGRLLCASTWHTETFSLWDVKAGVCVREFIHPNSGAHTCAFSPAADLLVIGGNDSKLVVRELRPAEPLPSFTMPGARQAPLSAACVSEEIVVLASGTRLAGIRRADGKVLFQNDMEEEFSAGWIPMALQPTGQQVAVCMAKPNAIAVHELPTGQELYRLKGAFDGWLVGMSYSRDGSLLVVYGGFSTQVFESTTGKRLYSLHSNEDESGHVHHGEIDPSNKLLLITGAPGCSSVKDLASGEVVHKLDNSGSAGGSCFDDAGERMAYFIWGGQVVFCDATDGCRELKRIVVPTHWVNHLQFSPGEGKFMLLAAEPPGGANVSGSWMIVDVETGEQPAWSKCLRAMMLPAGSFAWKTVRWVTPPLAQADDSPAPPLILQAAVGTELHLIDVSAFVRNFEEDGSFSSEQLNRLSEIGPEAIPTLLERWPHLVNNRDEETGDTVLHHCARMSNSTTAEKLYSRGVTEKWLSGKVKVTPLRNKEGHTALQDAIMNQRLNISTQLIKGLEPSLPPLKTGCLTQDLVAIGEMFTPAQLVALIVLLEDKGGFSIFRELRKLSVLCQALDELVVRPSADGSGEAPWASYEGDDPSVKCDSVLQVIALRGFAARPADDSLPPYTKLFNAAQGSRFHLSQLMRTELMKTTTKFKWEAHVRARVVRRIVYYVAHLMVAATALLVSSQTTEQSGAWGWSDLTLEWDTMNEAIVSDLLQAVLLLTNSLMLWNEITEVRLALVEQEKMKTKDATCWTALREHLSQGRNCCDLLGIVALFVASAAHFTRSKAVLQHVGAFGVLLNSFSFLKLVQPLEKSMGTLIEVLTQTSNSPEVVGFGVVMVVLIWGFGAAFTVSMPNNDAFYNSNRTVPFGLLPGLLTTTMSMVGDFDIDQYDFGAPFLMSILFLYIVIIVMFNVLIAIVSDLYADVKETQDVEVDMRRAEAIISAEARMSKAERCNPDYFPEFLEVLRVESVDETVQSVKVSQVQEDVVRLESRLGAKVDQQSEQMQEMAADMAELKALVAQLVQQGKPMPTAGFRSAVGQVMVQSRANKRTPLVH